MFYSKSIEVVCPAFFWGMALVLDNFSLFMDELR